ncbi:PAS domain-containing protein [bacterium]|nr:PAS domain-containing protein [bacterium]
MLIPQKNSPGNQSGDRTDMNIIKIKVFDNSLKKFNALLLCHLPLLFISVLTHVSGRSFWGSTKNQSLLFSFSLISIPIILLLLLNQLQFLKNTGQTPGKHASLLMLACFLLLQILRIGALWSNHQWSQLTAESAIAWAALPIILLSYVLADDSLKIGRSKKSWWIVPLTNMAIMIAISIFLALARPADSLVSGFDILMNLNALVAALFGLIWLFRMGFPSHNSRIFGILFYFFLQTSLLNLIIPNTSFEIIHSILLLATICTLALDSILLSPRALFENGFSFLSDNSRLRARIARTEANLVAQTQKSDQFERELSDTLLSSAATLDSMSAHICILDSNGRITAVNRTWREFAQNSGAADPNSFLGLNYLQICENDTSKQSSNSLETVRGIKKVLNGEISEFVTQYPCHAPTKRRWFLCRVTGFDSNLGRRLVVAHEDITDLKKAEEEILLKSVAIERANDGIVLTDPSLPDNPIVYVSAGFLKLTGYSEEEVLGRNCRFMQGPETDPAVVEKMRLAIEREEGFIGEVVNYSKAGRPWVNHLKLEPVRDSDGKLIRYVGVQMDITAQKKLEAERRRALELEMAARREVEHLYQEALNANTVKDEFLATLSHELRTPAGVIIGFTELLKYEDLHSSERDEALDALERNARALITLIDDLLDMSRVITGKFKLTAKPVDLTVIVESVISAEVLAAQAKNIRIVTEFEPGISPIYGDTTRLQQIFWNLLSNAIKFTPRNGRVKVAVRSEGARVMVRVADTGVGIDGKFLPHVFERFRQQDSGMNRGYGGLGLGLAIVKHLVELHGGAVWAESDGPGRGSIFTVSLPALTSIG